MPKNQLVNLLKIVIISFSAMLLVLIVSGFFVFSFANWKGVLEVDSQKALLMQDLSTEINDGLFSDWGVFEAGQTYLIPEKLERVVFLYKFGNTILVLGTSGYKLVDISKPGLERVNIRFTDNQAPFTALSRLEEMAQEGVLKKIELDDGFAFTDVGLESSFQGLLEYGSVLELSKDANDGYITISIEKRFVDVLLN